VGTTTDVSVKGSFPNHVAGRALNGSIDTKEHFRTPVPQRHVLA
jgi:hypothetical protein